MADRDAAAIAEFFDLLANIKQIHTLGIERKIEMHVDVDVELTRNFENAVDLSMRVAVRVRCCANRGGTLLQGGEKQFLGPWVIEQPLLRENANFDIDSPFIIGNELPYAFKAPEFDGGIDLEVRSHMRRAVQDALLQRPLGPGVNVLRRESSLQTGDLGNGLIETAV